MDKQDYINKHLDLTAVHKSEASVSGETYFPPKTEVIELASNKIMAKSCKVNESCCGFILS